MAGYVNAEDEREWSSAGGNYVVAELFVRGRRVWALVRDEGRHGDVIKVLLRITFEIVCARCVSFGCGSVYTDVSTCRARAAR